MSSQTSTQGGTVLLPPAEVARQASVSVATIYREVNRGALPAHRIGRQLRIDPMDFKRYLDRGAG